MTPEEIEEYKRLKAAEERRKKYFAERYRRMKEALQAQQAQSQSTSGAG
jgi:hypothetical protein